MAEQTLEEQFVETVSDEPAEEDLDLAEGSPACPKDEDSFPTSEDEEVLPDSFVPCESPLCHTASEYKKRNLRRRRTDRLRKRPEKPKSADAHVDEINRILAMEEPDLLALRKLSFFGFVNNEIRRVVWPLLLGVKRDSKQIAYCESGEFTHKYVRQVKLDIERSLFHFDTTKQLNKTVRNDQRKVLEDMIHTIFNTHPDLHYIQGFHDVCSVFYLVCGKQIGLGCAENLALVHIRDALRPRLDTIKLMLSLIFPLVRRADAEVHDFLTNAQAHSHFTLSWVLTWFSHDLTRFADVVRIFDFLLASPPIVLVYLAVALIIELREGLLECECDFASVHQYFQTLPKRMDVEELFAITTALLEEHKPQELFEESQIAWPYDSPMTVTDVTLMPNFVQNQRRIREFSHRHKYLPSVLLLITVLVSAVLSYFTLLFVQGF